MTKLLAPEVETELERFSEEIAKIEAGSADPDDFKRFRLTNGIYGIRGTTDRHMVRVKVRFGAVTPDQLDAIAGLAEDFTPTGITHLTTRQDFQFHNVKRSEIVAVLRRIAEAGLTTREACGNTVRNVTACPYAGTSPTEPFDVTPYADALSQYFLRNPLNQNLPRKIKIAFEGCSEDHARIPIHDIGAVAKVQEHDGKLVRGFQLYIAGGLGAQPRSATLLEDFTPADLLIPTAEAVIRVFDRYGERRGDRLRRMRARLKFLVREWGFEKVKQAILKERRLIVATRSGQAPAFVEPCEEVAPTVSVPHEKLNIRSKDYDRWLETNVQAQKQTGWNVVTVRCPLGDLNPEDLRQVAQVSRRFSGGRIRIAITQNLLLRWVPDAALPWVYTELRSAGLAHGDADRIADITRCPGADTCQIALTHSRGLAAALGDVFSNGFGGIPEIQNISIKISGCMNSCGQHHLADIGFHGATENVDGRELPAYVMMVGGRSREGLATFGKIAGKIPSRWVPDAVRAVLTTYLEQRQDDEHFQNFFDRVGLNTIRTIIRPYTAIPSGDVRPELLYDLGADELFKSEVGVGECAG